MIRKLAIGLAVLSALGAAQTASATNLLNVVIATPRASCTWM